jgi:hypothetical protein
MLTLQIAYEALTAAKLSPVLLCDTYVTPQGAIANSPRAISVYCPRCCKIILFTKIFELFDIGLNCEYNDNEEVIYLYPVNPTYQFIVNQIYQSNFIALLSACENLINNSFKPESPESFHLFNLLKWKLSALAAIG